MKAKVKAVVFAKDVVTDNGTFYQFNVLFETGLQGQYLAKNNPQTFFVQGQEAEFEMEQKTYGTNTYNKLKPVRNNAGGGYKVNPVYENKRIALRCAVQLVSNGIINKTEIRGYADNFLKYLSE
jgi:hypothetical protein